MVIYQASNSLNNYNYNGFMYQNCFWPYHFHKNLEVVTVLDGELEAVVDGEEIHCKKGSFLLILPNMVHHFYTKEYSKIWISVFSMDYVPEFSSIIKGKKKNTCKFLCSDEASALFSKYVIKSEKPDFFMLKASLSAICGCYLKDANLVPRTEPEKDISYETIKFIEKNFTEDIKMNDAANALGYEYHYFSRIFSKTFLINFKTLVNQYRLEYAQTLLQNEDMEITEIALKCGFGSIRNFNRTFKNILKTTPKEIRKKK